MVLPALVWPLTIFPLLKSIIRGGMVSTGLFYPDYCRRSYRQGGDMRNLPPPEDAMPPPCQPVPTAKPRFLFRNVAQLAGFPPIITCYLSPPKPIGLYPDRW